MGELNWKERMASGRDAARDGAAALSASMSESARETTTAARERLNAAYGSARDKFSDFAQDNRAVATGRKAVDRALLSSRDLIAERPVTAVVAGLAAGVVLGFLANHLTRSRRETAEAEEEFIGG